MKNDGIVWRHAVDLLVFVSRKLTVRSYWLGEECSNLTSLAAEDSRSPSSSEDTRNGLKSADALTYQDAA